LKYCPTCNREVTEGSVCPADGTPVQIRVQQRKDPFIGALLGERWKLDKQIGQGGMGAIYRGTDIRTQEVSAVKVLHPESDAPEEHAARFKQETQLLAQLNHPNVVRMLDSGATAEGRMYLVMEYLQGRTLDEVVPEEGIPVDSAVAVLEEICAGVKAAHARRLVHRDLKPENIFIARQPDGTAVVKVIDFGLAKQMKSDAEKTALTLAGKVVGSAGYVAPEHIVGGRVFTEQSDIYALGAIFYFMLTGRKPYQGESIANIMQAQIREKPPGLNLPEDHPAMAFEPVVRRAMTRAPEKRYLTTDALLAAVHQVLRKVQNPGNSRSDNNTLSMSGLTIKLSTARLSESNKSVAFGLGVAVGAALLLALFLGVTAVQHFSSRPPSTPTPANP